MYTTVKQRLIQFIKAENISIREFERTCGLSNGYIKSLRESPKVEKIADILSAYPELSRTWLLTGEGEMLNTTKVPVYDIGISDKGVPYVGDGENVTAGPLAGFGEAITPGDITDYINVPSLSWRDGDFAVRTRGRSMIDTRHPEQNINDGAIVCLRPWRESYIQWGEIYCIATTAGFAVKRLMPAESDNAVRCVSSNEDEGYAPYDVPADDIRAIAKVTAIINLQLL